MRKLLIFLAAALLLPSVALAQNCASYPNVLTNGTTADANQVMADFNLIRNCANANLAHNAANSDITSLAALTKPYSGSLGFTAPNIQILTGSGTYTTPTGALYLEVEMAGGGGATGGNGTGSTDGGNGVTTTFGSSLLTAPGGGGTGHNSVTPGVAGGVATGCDINLNGQVGNAAKNAPDANVPSSAGGATPVFGGAGPAAQAGVAGIAGINATGGGASGPGGFAGFAPVPGAASGSYCKKTIATPAGTYSYVVGAGGVAGNSGTGGAAGAAGGNGTINVTARFQ